MAKRRKVSPAKKPPVDGGDDQSLLLRSAESLGRVIGALQRQLDAATRGVQERKNTARPSKKATKSSGPAKASGPQKRKRPRRSA